jgi:cellobiose-specific phosphotransferase system component IIC
MLLLAARAAFALVHSVATIMAVRLEAIRHAEVPASVAEAFTAVAEAFTAAAAVMVVAVAVNMAGVYRLRRKNLRREWMLCDQRS